MAVSCWPSKQQRLPCTAAVVATVEAEAEATALHRRAAATVAAVATTPVAVGLVAMAVADMTPGAVGLVAVVAAAGSEPLPLVVATPERRALIASQRCDRCEWHLRLATLCYFLFMRALTIRSVITLLSPSLVFSLVHCYLPRRQMFGMGDSIPDFNVNAGGGGGGAREEAIALYDFDVGQGIVLLCAFAGVSSAREGKSRLSLRPFAPQLNDNGLITKLPGGRR